MWPLALFLLIAGTCSAQLFKEPPNTCLKYTQQNASIDLAIPQICCHFNTQECYFGHNGMCKRRWDTGDCDYTVDVCHHGHHNNWFCTCCASCDGPQDRSECKKDGGRCRRSCYKHEYFAWWRKCSDHRSGNECCRCCKGYCDGQPSCENGKGRCIHSSQECPKGSYISSDVCSGFGGCRCCVPCGYDPECASKKGFCEWKERKCPFGYVDGKCPCPDKECRCCHRFTKPVFGGGPAIKMGQQIEFNMPPGGSGGDDDPEGDEIPTEDPIIPEGPEP